MSVIDDLQQNIDDLSSNLDDVNSSLDAANSSVDDHETRLSTVEQSTQNIDPNRVGQLDFPLDPDTVNLIQNVFPNGTVQLVGGTAIVADSRIGTNTEVLWSVKSNNFTGTTHFIGYSISSTAVTFQSTNNTDTSVLVYQLITLQ